MIPISLNSEWNIITCTILPVISMPSLYPDDDQTNGIGDTIFTDFLSPAVPGKFIWGAGPVVLIPTNNDRVLGNDNWGLGASEVVLRLEKGNPWMYGVLVNTGWSISSDKQGGSYNNGLIQPFLNNNLPKGLYLAISPVATVNWDADSGNKLDSATRWRRRQNIPYR